MARIADRSDAIALRYFRDRDLRVDEKANRSPVTEADLTIEDTARRMCREAHPELGVYGEEEGQSGEGSSLRLIIDPIDATRNFVRGIPIFATLLAIEADGEVVAGLVSAPALGQRWSAARGKGAFEGERLVQVSGVTSLAQAQLFHGSLAGAEQPAAGPNVLGLIQRTQRQRGFGDFYQHVLVAVGAGEIAVDLDLAPWDIAAPQIVVEEAGGRATTLTGERSIYGGSLVSSNGLLHDESLAILRSLKP